MSFIVMQESMKKALQRVADVAALDREVRLDDVPDDEVDVIEQLEKPRGIRLRLELIEDRRKDLLRERRSVVGRRQREYLDLVDRALRFRALERDPNIMKFSEFARF
jgi:hypothetical protein